MLTADPSVSLTTIDEWVSTGSATTIGLAWNRTGRTWIAPTHPSPPSIYAIWDGGYLKDQNRQIVEPKVVISQISEGSNFPDINNAQLGNWHLYYWADAGAPLPPGFGGDASSCAFGGNHDAASCTSIDGLGAWGPHISQLADQRRYLRRYDADRHRSRRQLPGGSRRCRQGKRRSRLLLAGTSKPQEWGCPLDYRPVQRHRDQAGEQPEINHLSLTRSPAA